MKLKMMMMVLLAGLCSQQAMARSLAPETIYYNPGYVTSRPPYQIQDAVYLVHRGSELELTRIYMDTMGILHYDKVTHVLVKLTPAMMIDTYVVTGVQSNCEEDVEAFGQKVRIFTSPNDPFEITIALPTGERVTFARAYGVALEKYDEVKKTPGGCYL